MSNDVISKGGFCQYFANSDRHVIIPIFNTQFELYSQDIPDIDGTMLGLMGLNKTGYLGKKIASLKKTNNSKPYKSGGNIHGQ